MIRVVMLGRLGNNLFQYAFGRMLSEKHGVPLVMDASWFNARTWPYVSHLRSFPGISAGKARVARPFSFGSRLLKKSLGKHHWEYLGVPVIRELEADHSFDASLLEAPADCVAFGYFQTPLYFQGIEDLLRDELDTTHLGLETGHEALADKLRNPSSVAVHVRRTDYVNNPNLVSLDHGYYLRAMDSIRDSVPDARFHVFSDDPEWCAREFKGADIEVAMHPDPFSPLTDLHLMSLAAHHIIANSSFSWWAAWLGKKESQQVIMPSKWFHGDIKAPVLEKATDPAWAIIPTIPANDR